MIEIVKCKHCGKEIFFVDMVETGKKMPLNSRPTYGVQVNEETGMGFKVKLYSPHFGKCSPEGRKGLEKEYNREGE